MENVKYFFIKNFEVKTKKTTFKKSNKYCFVLNKKVYSRIDLDCVSLCYNSFKGFEYYLYHVIVKGLGVSSPCSTEQWLRIDVEWEDYAVLHPLNG